MKTFLIFMKIFFFAALLIISNGNLALADSHSRGVFVDRYTEWLGEMFHQGTDVVGYVVSTEWLPDNNYTGEIKVGR